MNDSVDKNSITINAYYNTGKQRILALWLVLWSLAGFAIITQLFLPMEDGMFTYFVVYIAFWVYFEYKVIYAFRWRKYGQEIISVEGDSLALENRISGRGIPLKFELEFVKNPRPVEVSETSFWHSMNQAYWNIGQESLVFDYKGKEIYFGRELNDSEQKRILKFIQELT
ncbi:MAG: hypothetical protein RH916_04135 [Vicingaceae bacterium]